MVKHCGNLIKMEVKLDSPVEYYLSLGEKICVNNWLKKKIALHFENQINCIYCGRDTKKSFNNGYCFPCSQKLAQCDFCILRPELCHFNKGTCREPQWGEENCMIPHYVYLANTSDPKIGITKKSQIPIRWIDQGATQALPILQVATRYQAGRFERLFGEHIVDKTNWRKMLKGDNQYIDLYEVRDQLFEQTGVAFDNLEEELGNNQIALVEKEDILEIEYPVLEFPTTVRSLTFKKQNIIEGILMGIKGQYLILDTGVFNVRNHSGHKVSLVL